MAELTDEQLLQHAAIDGYDNIQPGEYEASNEAAIEVYTSELLATMRAGIAADRAARPQPTMEALQAAYADWFKAEHLNNAPSPTAARTAALFTMAVLLGEVEL